MDSKLPSSEDQEKDDEYPRGITMVRLTGWEWVFLVMLCSVGGALCLALFGLFWVTLRFLWALAF